MSRAQSSYFQGVRHSAPFIIVAFPFAMLFGVVATEAGFNLAEVMGFSVLVIAGAAQFTAIQLMEDNAPVLIVLATSLAVNLRMAMYSASLAPYLGAAPLWQRALIAYLNVDQSYALSVQKYEAEPALSLNARVAYFLGTMTPLTPVWYLGTLAGILLGNRIPEAFPLDFAVPITFIALVAPMLKSLAHVTAAFVSVTGALVLSFLPAGLGLIIAAFAAMLAGAEVERRLLDPN